MREYPRKLSASEEKQFRNRKPKKISVFNSYESIIFEFPVDDYETFNEGYEAEDSGPTAVRASFKGKVVADIDNLVDFEPEPGKDALYFRTVYLGGGDDYLEGWLEF